MTRKAWDAVFWERFGALRKAYPAQDLVKVQEKAHRQTENELGPRPPGMTGILLNLAAEYLKTGGNMDFSWTKNVWKGVRAALASALTIALVAGGEALLGAFDSKEELMTTGVPLWAIPLMLALVSMARNFLKVKKGVKVP